MCIPETYEVICAGQAVLDCITRGKETEPYKENVYRAETIRLHPGGDAVNEASALASLGIRTAVVCGLGKDLAGDAIVRLLTEAGVHTERIRRLPMDTPVANLMVAKDGSRISVNSRATELPGYRIRPEELAGAKIVSFASLFRPPFADMAGVAALIRAAAAQHAVICCDTKLPLDGSIRLDALAEVLPMIDYLFPNEHEAAYYTGKETFPEMAAVFRSYGVKQVIIKAGAEGCYVSGPEGDFRVPAVPVEKVVDTTGAGDHFVAGFMAGILQGASLRDCAESGVRLAARAITHTGGAGQKQAEQKQ